MTEAGPDSGNAKKVDKIERLRADRLLVERGFFESRARARAAIEAKLVKAAGRIVERPSDLLPPDVAVEADQPFPWVSRGGVKLQAALDAAGLDVTGLEGLDVGASTGGFTEVLLERGARAVHAVDVGRGQLHARLRGDPRIVSLEATDIRALSPGQMPPAGIITVDVSFISLLQVLPAIVTHAAAGAHLVALVKPQFEVGRDKLSKGGIVKDAGARADALAAVLRAIEGLGWHVLHTLDSPIAGGDGNVESLVVARQAAGRRAE